MLKEQWARLSLKLQAYFRSPEQPFAEKELPWFILVEKARLEWREAEIFFNEVTEPELIKQAVFALEAAERKYLFLLRKARREKAIHEDWQTFLR